MASLLSLSIVLLHLLSCFNEVAVAASTSTCEKRCSKPFGSCLCYCELEESLLATEENTVELTSTFFPAEDNPPEFVTVLYRFNDTNNTIDPQTWYWSAQTSHFLHPFEVFQFLSLFFGKPEPYYTGRLDITLKAECADLSSTDIEKLQLLTQRLKLYAERGNLGLPNLLLSDTYNAKAYNEETLKDVLTADTNRIINIIICGSVFVILFSVIIIVILMITFFCSKSHKNSEWIESVKEKKPTVLSLAVLSGIANLYILTLASSALGNWYDFDDKRDILHSFGQNINKVPLCTTLLTDFVALIFWIIFMAVAGVIYCTMPDDKVLDCSLWSTYGCGTKCGGCDKIKHKRSLKLNPDNSFIVLSLTVLCPFFCIIAHSPYIAIAYLNDGDHASSIFIYYTVLCYIIFGVTWLFFHWCQHFIEDKNENDAVMVNENWNKKKGETDHADKQDNKMLEKKTRNNRVLCCCTLGKIENGETGKLEATSKEKKHCFITAVIILLCVALLFLFGLIVVISCYFVLIPINKSISNAPNRILSIYQSGGFLIGSFIVYNILKYFYSKNKEDKDKDIGQNVENIHIILQKWLSHPKHPNQPASGSSNQPAPGSGSQSAPVSGSQPAPGSGSQPAPASGSQPAPGSGSQAPRASGSQPAPGSGSQAPAERECQEREHQQQQQQEQGGCLQQHQ